MLTQKIKKTLKNFVYRDVSNFTKTVRSFLSHRNEIKKFKDKRRVEIYSKVSLTERQKEEIDILFKQNYGKRVPYTWHRHFTAFTGNFDKNYFPELLYIPEFEAYMNLNKYYNRVFSDKNLLPNLAVAAGIKVPKTIVCCVKGVYKGSGNNIISKGEALDILNNSGCVFVKPSVDSCSGKACAIIDINDGVDKISQKPIESIINELGSDFVIQEKIVCHKTISDLYPNSVNTFRIITYIWKDKIKMFPAIMRIGSGGSCVDNAHAGGMFIAVNEDGTLHKTAFTEFKKEYTNHPDTGVCYEGYKIEMFPEVLNSAKKMHELIPQIGVANWDFTIDEDGIPVLVEVNITSGSVWLPQIAHGKGAFGEDTAEVLRWMALMKKTKPSDRYKYAYGKCE